MLLLSYCLILAQAYYVPLGIDYNLTFAQICNLWVNNLQILRTTACEKSCANDIIKNQILLW